jgi:hypothetical protein
VGAEARVEFNKKRRACLINFITPVLKYSSIDIAPKQSHCTKTLGTMERLAPIPDCYLLPTPVILIYEMKIISMFIEMLDTLDTAGNVQHL